METFYSNDMYATNRINVVMTQNHLFDLAKKKEDSCLYLHLGCGPEIKEGFVNVDKYFKDPRVVNYDFFKLPYEDASVDLIYCSHSLEHLPIRHAKMALSEWGRVLKTKGKLYLAIPDLQIIIHKLLDENISEQMYDWLLYTLFGYQTHTENNDPSILDYEIDPGQFHVTGFTKKMIIRYLERNNIKITKIFNYDGWGTPSIWIEAEKN